MAGVISKILKVSVTNGDAVAENRLGGRSNTGTYFICSNTAVFFEKFGDFFQDGLIYRIDLDKIREYQLLLKHFIGDKKELYPDEMNSLNNYCSKLLEIKEPLVVGVDKRINDTRVFMKFENNDKYIEKCFRHILYAEISEIVFEIKDGANICFIYPLVNIKNISKLKPPTNGLQEFDDIGV